MLLPKLKTVCMQCFKSVAPKVCQATVPFLPYFGHDLNTKMGVVIFICFKNFHRLY